MSEDFSLHITLPAENWWWIVAYLEEQLPRIRAGMELRWEKSLMPPDTITFNGYGIGTQTKWLDIQIRRHTDGMLHIMADEPLFYPGPVWKPIMDDTVAFAQRAQAIRREIEPTAYEVIERYYRSRAAGGRKTLRDIAEGTPYSYDYLRKVKRDYDADGEWGSRKEPKGSLKLE